MTTVVGRKPRSRQDAKDRSLVARAALLAGGGFTTAVGAVLSAATYGAVGGPVALAGLSAVCFIAAVTMFTSAYIMTRR